MFLYINLTSDLSLMHLDHCEKAAGMSINKQTLTNSRKGKLSLKPDQIQ